MQNSRDVLLCSTLNDERGVFFGLIQNVSSVVAKNYIGWVINVTSTTDQRTKDAVTALASSGVYLTETDPAHPIVPDPIENDHLYLLGKTVGIAKKLGVRKVQYTDCDRIITAATHFPEDLKQMAQRASEMVGDTKSYINFRRSIEAATR